MIHFTAAAAVLDPNIFLQVASLVPEGDLSLKPPGGCPETVRQVMESCWQRDPSLRLTFGQILQRIEEAAPERGNKPPSSHSNPTYGATASPPAPGVEERPAGGGGGQGQCETEPNEEGRDQT